MSDIGWVATEPLKAVLLRIIVLYRHQQSKIDGPLLALFAKRLLKHEVSVGGPYSDEQQSDDLVINALIEHLFEAFGSPLPNVTHYLKKHDPSGAARRTIETLISTAEQDMYPSALQPKPTNKISAPSSVALGVERDLGTLPTAMQPVAREVWSSVLKADHKHEISLLAQQFIESITTTIEQPKLAAHTLGMANFYTWMAYTIYDDFIDQEGDPTKLPIANMAHRKAIQLYNSYVLNSTTRETIQQYFTEMDTANEWELNNARFATTKQRITITTIPDYEDGDILARRALGHILGPMLVCLSNESITQSQRDKIHTGLKHYLIARQINDDLHDWVEDLRRGHVSFVVAHLLRTSGIPEGTQLKEELIEKLKGSFWKTELVTLANITVGHIDTSYEAFESTKLFNINGPLFKTIIEPIRTSATESMAIHQDQKKFLETYRQ